MDALVNEVLVNLAMRLGLKLWGAAPRPQRILRVYFLLKNKFGLFSRWQVFPKLVKYHPRIIGRRHLNLLFWYMENMLSNFYAIILLSCSFFIVCDGIRCS